MRKCLWTLPLLLCIDLLATPSAASSTEVVLRNPAPATRSLPTGLGPWLDSFDAAPPPLISRMAGPESAVSVEKASIGQTYVDLPCDVFTPGKADPSEWMASATIARVTYDGYQWFYGYDPMAQSYDVMVSGLVDSYGYLIQETVGELSAELPSILTSTNILNVELWMLVAESNLFPNEYIGITDLEYSPVPSSSLNSAQMQTLYDDARGYSGEVYFLDSLAPGPHAIDLGSQAVADMSSRIGSPGWFGVGLAADGWDLSGSLGVMVYWKIAGGGSLPESNHPFLRVYYNAPPNKFSLVQPTNGQILAPGPLTMRWDQAVDPNGDTPVEYALRLGADPLLENAFELDAGTDLTIGLPFSLDEGIYHWEVVATDPGGESRTSQQWSFQIAPTGTDAPSATGQGRLDIRAVPNPFNPRTEIRFRLESEEYCRIRITDLRGRVVRTLHEGMLAAGEHRQLWDGSDRTGSPCASGMYFATVSTPSGAETVRLTLVR